MHRVGGLEKEDVSGNVSYDPENHQKMTNTRAQKVQNVNQLVAPQSVFGPESGDAIVVSWGGTFGSCRTAVSQLQREGHSIAHAHLRWLNPLPANLSELLQRYRKVIIPELNCGQLRTLIQAQLLISTKGINKVKGKPFSVSELKSQIVQAMKD